MGYDESRDLESGKALQATYVNEGGKYIYDVIVVREKSRVRVAVDAATHEIETMSSVTPTEEDTELTERFKSDCKRYIGTNGN